MIVAIIPAYNEEQHVGEIVRRALNQVGVGMVIVCDDGSSDNTVAVASRAGANIIRHYSNRGYGAAVISLLEEAKKKVPSATVVLLDSDGQHDPDDIPSVVGPIAQGYDLVVGRRRNGDVPFYRLIGGGVLSVSARMLTRTRIRDTQCGFRAFSPKALRVLELKEQGMGISSETVMRATWAGLRMCEVPVSIRYTQDSSTHNPVAQGFYTLARVLMVFGKQVVRAGRIVVGVLVPLVFGRKFPTVHR